MKIREAKRVLKPLSAFLVLFAFSSVAQVPGTSQTPTPQALANQNSLSVSQQAQPVETNATQQSTPQITPSLTPAANFQKIASDRTLWPQNVVLKAPLVMPFILNGKDAGSVTLPVGTTVQLVSVNADGTLVVSQNGNQGKIGAERTNFTVATTTATPVIPTATPVNTVEQQQAAHIKNLEYNITFYEAKVKSFEAEAVDPHYSAQVRQECRNEAQAAKADLEKLRDELEKIKDETNPKEYEAYQLAKKAKELHIQVTQVIRGGVLADPMEGEYVDSPVVADSLASVGGGGRVGGGGGGMSYSPSGRTIFVQGVIQDAAEGQELSIKAYQDGTYIFRDTSGASRTVEKWVLAR